MEEQTQELTETFRIDANRLHVLAKQLIAYGVDDMEINRQLNIDIDRQKRGEPLPTQLPLPNFQEQ